MTGFLIYFSALDTFYIQFMFLVLVLYFSLFSQQILKLVEQFIVLIDYAVVCFDLKILCVCVLSKKD